MILLGPPAVFRKFCVLTMKIKHFEIEGLIEFFPDIHEDDRGCFVETWQENRYRELGISSHFVQDNFSFSVKGTLRGLHFQRHYPQGKLITVLKGEVFDAAVDLRRNSLTFGRWQSVLLNGEEKNQLWIPPGFAHGFYVITQEALVSYKCTDFYHPNDEGCIRWDDPDIGVSWPLLGLPKLSQKDAQAKSFKDLCEGSLS